MGTTHHPESGSDRLTHSDVQADAALLRKPDRQGMCAAAKADGVPAYDLRLGEGTSQQFYGDVAAFSARVVGEIENRAAAALDGYARYVSDALGEAERSRGEYGLELLTLGMALQLYSEVAAATPGWVIALARELYGLRHRFRRMKPALDFVRAGLFELFMRKTARLGGGGPPGPGRGEMHSCVDLERPIEWLKATGEFNQEAQRLDNWIGFLARLAPGEAEGWVATSVSLFDWFRREAEDTLGKYTTGVAGFLETTYAARFWREDQLFCGRQPVEYHLGMVASEVMNDGLSGAFSGKSKKVLLVPTCMRGARGDDCKAVVRGLDIRCAGCDPECAINRISKRMRAEGVQVFMVPHSSGFSRWLERWQSDPNVGVAAVACMMNILAGGYEMRARGIASQCVPLDYPGCKKHWTRDGVPTGVNGERLEEIVTRS
jgi:uncharacterized protein